MNGRILLWSITSALAGFLFGFDTVVISGAEQSIQAQWGLGAGIHGIVDGLGAIWHSARLADRRLAYRPVRAQAYAACSSASSISFGAVGSAVANDPIVFIVARMIGGLGIGISTVAAPLYISEIAPPKYRGRLAGMFQFNIVFGILMAFLSNALLAGIGENAWRWMLGVAAFPSLAIRCLVPRPARKPAWLLGKKNDREAGVKVLRLIEPEASEARNRKRCRCDPGRILVGKHPQARFWTRRASHAHHAGLPHRVLQSTFRHQRDALLRPAHFRTDRARRESRPAAIGRHRRHQPHLHFRWACG